LPQYHHFSSLALHKSQHPFKKDNAVLVDFSFRGGHIIVDFLFFSFFFECMTWLRSYYKITQQIIAFYSFLNIVCHKSFDHLIAITSLE
jgi:hypothetical protein